MSWDDVKDQHLAKRLFQAHLASGVPGQAYLLAGPDGVGKRSLALEMAKAINCLEQKTEACGACRQCRQITAGNHPDLHMVSGSGASQTIKIDDIRHILGRVSLRPFNARAQVVIVDGAERLTEEAANSLLKTLEEPSASTRFLLLTANPAACLPTVRSRCQLIYCRPLSPEVLEQIIREQAPKAAGQAGVIALAAHGSAAKALDLAGRWDEVEALRARLDAPTREWLRQPMPETREGISELLEVMITRLRERAAEAAQAGEREAPQRRVEAAERLLALRESLDQFVSPRLVATMARETWLNASLVDSP